MTVAATRDEFEALAINRCFYQSRIPMQIRDLLLPIRDKRDRSEALSLSGLPRQSGL